MNIMSRIIPFVFTGCLLAACGSSDAADSPSEKVTESVVESAVESVAKPEIEYSQIELDDIIIPASAKAKIEDKGNSSYTLKIDDTWETYIYTTDAGNDIVPDRDKMYEKTKALFLLFADVLEPEEARKISCVDAEDYINGYEVYVYSYKGDSGLAAWKMLGNTYYTIYSINEGYNADEYPSEEDFKAFIESLEIAP